MPTLALRRRVRGASRPALTALVVAGASAALYLIALALILHEAFDLVYVATGSMEPSVPRYSLVLVRQTGDPGSLGLGEVAVYTYPQAPGVRFMHRIIASDYQGDLTFKGDAVENPESLPASRVEAVMVAGIPRAMEPGVRVLQDPGATFITVLALSAILAGYIIGRA